MNEFKTKQEAFWAGDFGDKYTIRNRRLNEVAGNISLFTKILVRTENIKSVIEFGANLGMNLMALRQLLPLAELSAIEINKLAVEQLTELDYVKVYNTSILEFDPDYKRDLVFTKTFLIHINPEMLTQVYDILYQSSNRFICVIEYYNPKPIEVEYRGYSGKLFKRDFAGEILDRYHDLKLNGYGFIYHRDRMFPLDDITWFLLEKTSRL